MVKINLLEIENIKRVKAFQLEPVHNGLTVIGGRNGQGKTSVLDAIAWALGGDKFKPSQPQRTDSVIPPHLKVVLSNGLVVERNGKNSALKIIDPQGNRAGQQLLNEFVEQFALNLPKFMRQSSKEKAQTLLKIIGVGDKLYDIESKEQSLYNQRRAIGQIADQKSKYAKEMPFFQGVPSEPISASELIKRQQKILAHNGENQRLRDNAVQIQREYTQLELKITSMRSELEKLLQYQKELNERLSAANKTVAELEDESTLEIEQSIADIEDVNNKIRTNLEREKAEMDAEYYQKQYDAMTIEIENLRQSKTELLKNADLPLPGLSVEDGELTYNGFKWDNMSGSEQLKVSTAIVRRLNPNCGFVLLDKLEQMDSNTLSEFNSWLQSEGLQAIATRVSTGNECSIIIEDGLAEKTSEKTVTPKAWKAGVF